MLFIRKPSIARPKDLITADSNFQNMLLCSASTNENTAAKYHRRLAVTENSGNDSTKDSVNAVEDGDGAEHYVAGCPIARGISPG